MQADGSSTLETLDIHEAKIKGLEIKATPRNQNEAIDLASQLLATHYFSGRFEYLSQYIWFMKNKFFIKHQNRLICSKYFDIVPEFGLEYREGIIYKKQYPTNEAAHNNYTVPLTSDQRKINNISPSIGINFNIKPFKLFKKQFFMTFGFNYYFIIDDWGKEFNYFILNGATRI